MLPQLQPQDTPLLPRCALPVRLLRCALYGRHRLLTVIAYGSLTEDEAATMEQLAQRNAINMGYNEAKFIRCESAEKVGEML